MISRFMNSRSKTVTAAAVVLMASAGVSRLLGIVRDRLLAVEFGASADLDVYFAAFRIPDLLYAFLVSWGVAAVFLPLFSERMAESKEKAWHFASNMLNVYAVGLGVFVLLGAIAMPALMKIVAPGFTEDQQILAVALSRLMLLSPFFFALSSVAAGVLHYFERFVAYALAPVLYNLGIIMGILFFVPSVGVWGLAYGVLLGAMLHFLIHVPSLFSVGFSWKPVFSFFDASVQRALLLSIPRAIGGVAHHINLIVVTALASTLSVGSIAVFNFANNLQYVPVGIIGLPMALAVFPVLSRSAVARDWKLFYKSLRATLWRVGIITLPLATGMFLFKETIVSIVLQGGEFTQADTELTASILGIFILGMLFQGFIPVLVRAFFALQDTKSPTIAGVLAVVLNIALAILFLRVGWGIFGLPWALVISGGFQMALLSLLLIKKKARVQ